MKSLTLASLSVTILLLSLPSSARAEEKRPFEYKDAAWANLRGAIKSGATAGAAGFAAVNEKFFQTTVLDQALVPEPFTEDTKKVVLEQIRKGKFSNFGIGSAGGAAVEIELDERQVHRYLSSKNLGEALDQLPSEKMKTVANNLSGGEVKKGLVGDVRTGKTASPEIVKDAMETVENTKVKFTRISFNLKEMPLEQLERQLKRLADLKINVRKVVIKSIGQKVAEHAINVTAIGASILGIERLVAAGVRALDADHWRGDEGAPAYSIYKTKKPSLWDHMISAGPGAAYNHYNSGAKGAE